MDMEAGDTSHNIWLNFRKSLFCKSEPGITATGIVDSFFYCIDFWIKPQGKFILCSPYLAENRSLLWRVKDNVGTDGGYFLGILCFVGWSVDMHFFSQATSKLCFKKPGGRGAFYIRLD